MPRIIPGYKEEVRKKVIEASYNLFLTKGYSRTTMDDIAGALGVTKPALYQYFPGKEDLYAAVAEYARQELKGILERSYRDRDVAEGSGALFDALSLYAPHFHSMYSEMILLSLHSERIRQILDEDLREDIRVIEGFVAHQQETGYVSERLDPHVLAVSCHAMINGLLLDIATGMDREEAKRIWITMLRALLQAE
jgi:AcrR family transcriptional regulator